MRSLVIAAVLAPLLAALVGCQQDHYARQLLCRDTTFGKLSMTMTGDADALVKSGKITARRTIVAPDEAALDVWVIAARGDTPPKGAVLLLHGMGDSKASYLSAGQKLASLGFDVALPDLRSHGASGGQYITYGARESADLKLVMDRLAADGLIREPYYVVGVNLGGSAGLIYASDEPKVRGVVVVSPYKDFVSIATWLMQIDKLTYGVMLPKQMDTVIAGAQKMGDFSNQQTSSLEAARKLKAPLIVAYTLVDASAPMEHAQAVHDAAAGPRKLVLITPLVEQLVVGLFWDEWIAQRVGELASGQLKPEPPATAPAH
jgi:pimeloyl-ACP methyl ester carboxylesterase